MNFPQNAYLATAVTAFVATLIAMPAWRWWCLRTGHVDNPAGRKNHERPVALSGGLAVLTGFLAPVVIGLAVAASGALADDAVEKMIYGFGARRWQLLAIFGGALAVVVLGWIDDKHELRPAVKFGGQLLIALAVAASGIRITLFVDNVVFSYAVTLLWMLTLINALNFMDNMNGLCSGVGAIAGGFFAVIAAGHGQYLVAMLAIAITAALLGFLPFNYPSASSFLGDAGSHLVGFLLAVLGILPHFYSEAHPVRLAVISPLLVLAVPLIDLAWVVMIRWRLGKPFYVGDHNHMSHRLVRRGWSKAGAVALLWGLAAGFGVIALWLNRF